MLRMVRGARRGWFCRWLDHGQPFFCEPNPSAQRTSIRAERRVRIRALGKELSVESNAPTLLSLNSVTKVFSTDEVETHALAGIELNVRKGKYISISGPSGCGKSTLLAILGLLDTPSDGSY